MIRRHPCRDLHTSRRDAVSCHTISYNCPFPVSRLFSTVAGFALGLSLVPPRRNGSIPAKTAKHGSAVPVLWLVPSLVGQGSKLAASEDDHVWCGQATGTLSLEHRGHLTIEKLGAWLSEDAQRQDPVGEETGSRLARFILAGRASPIVPQPEGQLQKRDGPEGEDLLLFSQLVDRLGLRTAHDYALSSIAGVTTFPQEPARGDTRSYAVVYHPKLAAIWSASTTATPSTHAIILADSTDGVECRALQELLEVPWDPGLAAHPLFPAFLCGVVLSRAIDDTQEGIKMDIRTVESLTGIHRFKTRPHASSTDNLDQNLESLNARVSAFASKLASTARKIRVASEVQKFILENARDHDPRSAAELVEDHAHFMDRRLQMQLLDNNFLLERTRIQSSAILNLISHKNANMSLLAAQTTMHDSSSMKTLALVALIFLPGNFVAALFSAPLFNWDEADADADARHIGVAAKPQFTLYWTITMPLTIAVFFLHFGWWLMRKRRWRIDAQRFSEPYRISEA